MANREALRELQVRLASRLQTAKAEGLSISWLAVRAGEGNYLLPLAQSGQIFPVPHIQTVAYAQPWFLGVGNLQGGLFGVIDFSAFIKGGLVPAKAGQQFEQARVVTLNAALEINCALLVDELAGLKQLNAFTASVPPPAGAPACFGNSYSDEQGVFWQEVNLQSLSKMPEFLGVGN